MKYRFQEFVLIYTQLSFKNINCEGYGENVFKGVPFQLKRKSTTRPLICSRVSFIAGVMEMTNFHDWFFFRYNCCELKDKRWHERMDCYYTSTPYTSDGDGNSYYLDKQVVKCKEGYALNFFKLHRNYAFDSYRYRLKCCRVKYNV